MELSASDKCFNKDVCFGNAESGLDIEAEGCSTKGWGGQARQEPVGQRHTDMAKDSAFVFPAHFFFFFFF